jgi:hypothetical protein
MPEVSASRYVVTCGWDDVPHLDETTKSEMLASIPPHLRDARSKGIPSLGSGAIYPIGDSELKVAPFALPDHWPRGFAIDVGWKRTAAIFGAHDRETDTVFLYAEHYLAEAPPSVHAAAIRARGIWLPGVIDPAAQGRAQSDGHQLIHDYRALGLDLEPAVNSVEAGLLNVWERMMTGRLKVFATCQNWWAEYRLYRRDESGRVVKHHDHLMDCTRYLVVSGVRRFITRPIARDAGPRRRGDRVIGY